MMVLVRVEMPSFRYGRKVYPRDYEFNESLWFELYSFALGDEFSMVFKSNANRLQLCKSTVLDKLLEDKCVGNDEVKFLRDYHKQGYHSSILVERVFVANRFDRRCVRVNGDYAYFLSRNGNEFKVLLSDKVKGKVMVGDLCTVTVTCNRDWLVTDVVVEDDGYDSSINELLGGY